MGPLANVKDLWIHGGYNNWKDGLSIVEKLDKFVGKDGDWWYANGMLLSFLSITQHFTLKNLLSYSNVIKIQSNFQCYNHTNLLNYNAL